MKRGFRRKFISICLTILIMLQGLPGAVIPINVAAGTEIGTMTFWISKSESGSTLIFTANPSTTYTGGSYSYQWQTSSDGGTSVLWKKDNKKSFF